MHKHVQELTSVMLYKVDSHICGYKVRWAIFLTVPFPQQFQLCLLSSFYVTYLSTEM